MMKHGNANRREGRPPCSPAYDRQTGKKRGRIKRWVEMDRMWEMWWREEETEREEKWLWRSQTLRAWEELGPWPAPIEKREKNEREENNLKEKKKTLRKSEAQLGLLGGNLQCTRVYGWPPSLYTRYYSGCTLDVRLLPNTLITATIDTRFNILAFTSRLPPGQLNSKQTRKRAVWFGSCRCSGVNLAGTMDGPGAGRYRTVHSNRRAGLSNQTIS